MKIFRVHIHALFWNQSVIFARFRAAVVIGTRIVGARHADQHAVFGPKEASDNGKAINKAINNALHTNNSLERLT